MRAPALGSWEVLSHWERAQQTSWRALVHSPKTAETCRAVSEGWGVHVPQTSVPEDFPGRGELQGGVFIALSNAQRSPPAQQCWCWGVGPLWRSGARVPFTIGAVFVLTEEGCVALGSASRFPGTPSYN